MLLGRFIFIVAAGLFAPWFSAQANNLNLNMVSEQFVCPAQGDDNVLREQSVQVQGGDANNKQAVVTALTRLQNLSRGTFPFFKNKTVIFKDHVMARDPARGCLGGSEEGGSIVLALSMCPASANYCKWKGIPASQCPAPGTPLSSNSTTIIHEIGHRVGNTNGLYGQYRSKGYQSTACKLTSYCSQPSRRSGHGEEFSEAFALFVTKPSKLKSLCPGAYKFFKEKVFQSSADPGDCEGGRAEPPPEKPGEKPRPRPVPRENLDHDADEVPGTGEDCDVKDSSQGSLDKKDAVNESAFDFNQIMTAAPTGISLLGQYMQQQALQKQQAAAQAAYAAQQQQIYVGMFGPWPLTQPTSNVVIPSSAVPGAIQYQNNSNSPIINGR